MWHIKPDGGAEPPLVDGAGESPCLDRKVPTLSEEGAAVGGVVPSHCGVLGLLHARSFGSLPPRLQRFRVSLHLDGIDPFTIHRVSRDGDLDTPIGLAGASDEVTGCVDIPVPILGIHEFVSGNDDHVPPRGARLSLSDGYSGSGS